MMTAEQAFQQALLAALKGIDGLNGVFDAPPTRASAPWAELGDMVTLDWGTKNAAGRELRPVVILHDRGDSVARLQALAGAVEQAVAAMAPDLPGWRIVSLAPVRKRFARAGSNGWTAAIEHRARLLAG